MTQARHRPSAPLQVLNLLLCRLSGRPYDEQLLAFLRVDELLVDISDDLVDYEVTHDYLTSYVCCPC